jgi:gliding motility-associated-like protein
MTCGNCRRFLMVLVIALQSVIIVNAQVIIPKQAPIILKLNTSGTHEMKVTDVAVISGASATTSFSPASFDCGDLGKQQVFVTTSTLNGTNVSFNNPAGLAFDSFGNIYVSDIAGQKVRKITPAGIVTTLAGSGAIGFVNAKGTAASFSSPNGLVIDADGNIYVADMNNHVIRKITQNGNVTTFAGSGKLGNADGQGTLASFNAPTSLTIDATGNIYVVDEFNNNIRKIDVNGAVTTLAGSGFAGYADGLGKAASFSLPYGITIDVTGDLYVTDIQNYRIRKITPQGLVSTFAGNGNDQNKDGTSLTSSFSDAYGIIADAANNIYVYSGSQLRKITPAGVVTTIAGGIAAGKPFDGVGSDVRFNRITALARDGSGNMYFTDTYNNLLRKITPAGEVTTIAGTGTAISKDGTIGDLATIDDRQKYIPVTIVPTIVITNKPQGGIVDYNNCPPFLKAYTFGTDEYCEDLNEKTLRPKPYSYQFVQTPSPGTLLPNNVPTAVKLVVIDSNGATDSVSFTVTAINGNYNQAPSVAINASQNPVCMGAPVKFTPIVNNPPANLVFSWYVNGKIQLYNDSFTTSNLKDGDTVTCVLGAGNSVCNTPVSSEPYIVSIVSPPTINFDSSPFIEPGNSVQLKPVIAGGAIVKYSWSPSAGLSSDNIEQPMAAPLETTNYTLTITSENGCVVQQSVKVRVDTDLHIPNAFTPNGDGINDLWKIKSLLAYPQCTVNVFNRYGQQVYYSRGYSGWDGTYKGKALPGGTYYYIIKTTASNPTFSGNVTIIR